MWARHPSNSGQYQSQLRQELTRHPRANKIDGIISHPIMSRRAAVDSRLQSRTRGLTNNVAQDLPAPHSHSEQDLVLHDQDSDAKEDADETDVAAPVIEVGLEEGDDCVDLL